MPMWPKILMTPAHVFHAVSPADLEAKMRAHAATGRAAHPHLIWPDPWRSVLQPTVYVNCGRWMVTCLTPACGDCPMVHPSWRMAGCFNCGAVYADLEMPADAEQIEAVLVERPNVVNRNWMPHETLADLIAENVTHGEAA